MSTVSLKSEEILDLAEAHMRSAGYNGFSFRDLADAAGIKSASVHYHFATKEILAAAVARRYADRFLEVIGDPCDDARSQEERLEVFVGLFRHALQADGRVCLFCLLGAEFTALPPSVQAEVSRFYLACTDWLARLLAEAATTPTQACTAQAQTVIATLEGAMLVARASDDLAMFDTIVGQLHTHGLLPPR